MKRLALIVLLLPLLAWADDKPDNRPPDNRPPHHDGGSVDIGDVGGTTTSGSESDASAASESVSEANGGNSAVTFTSPDDITIRNVPSISAPDIFPTVSCFKGTSFSLGVPGAGGSFGGGKIDEECTKREEIRLAAQIGYAAQALFRWCGLPNNIEDFGSREKCMNYGAPTTSSTSTSTPPQITENYVTEQELTIADEEIMVVVAAVDERLQGIERRLNANAAAARREEQERETWKTELAANYLPQETTAN